MPDMTIRSDGKTCDIPAYDDIGNPIVISIDVEGLSEEQRTYVKSLDGFPGRDLLVERARPGAQTKLRYIPFFYGTLLLTIVIVKLTLTLIS